MASLAEATTESVERNNARLNDALLFGVSKSAGLIPMKDRVKGASTDRCKVVRPNAFAYNPMRINIGSIARNESADTLMVSPDYVVFEAQPDCLLPEYLDHFRRSHAWQSFVGAAGDGSVRVRIYYDHLSQLRLPLPPRAEQRKIAAILEAVDDKLDVIARQIEATQSLKQGLMQALFSRGAGVQIASGAWLPHEEFKEGPIGKVPQCWEFCTLDDLAVENITYGVVQPGEALVGGVPMVRGGDIKDGEIAQNLRTISSEVSSQFKRTILEGGELLVSLVGYPGETAVVPPTLKGANIARQAGMIRTGSLALSNYLHCYLASPAGKAELLGGMIGSAQQVINLKSLREVQVPMPPEAERDQITAVCEATSAKLRTLYAKQRSYGLLKRGLMQKLLTGEWRVKVDAKMAA